MNWQEQILSKNIKQTGIFKELTPMTRLEKLETLIKIEESIQYYENQINELVYSNQLGAGDMFMSIRLRNTHDMEIYDMCIDRLEERFNKLANTLK